MTLGKLISLCKSESLLLHFFSKKEMVLNSGKEVDGELCLKILDAKKRNENGEPLAYIFGERAFYKDVFKVNKHVLIPQPDSETLVEQAVSYLKTLSSDKVSVLDLCAGTGCIGISIAKEISNLFSKTDLFLSDVSPEAVSCFSENAENLISDKSIETHFITGNMFENVPKAGFDIIVSNPPYIPTSVIPTLSAEVQNEPFLALDGGKDGLDFYKILTTQSSLYMKKGAYLMVEIGYDQGQSVKSLFVNNCFSEVKIVKDLGNNDRVVKGFIK